MTRVTLSNCLNVRVHPKHWDPLGCLYLNPLFIGIKGGGGHTIPRTSGFLASAPCPCVSVVKITKSQKLTARSQPAGSQLRQHDPRLFLVLTGFVLVAGFARFVALEEQDLA